MIANGANRITQDKEVIIARALIEEIRKSSQEIIDEIGNGLTINNIDEVSASLHNEGNRSSKLLLSALSKIQTAVEQQSKVLGQISRESSENIANELKGIKIDELKVNNLSEIKYPEEIYVNNFAELIYYIQKLDKSIQAIESKPPEVNVAPPQVNVDVPAPIINVPPMDMGLIEDYLRLFLRKIKDNNKSNPMFVRMTELDRVIDKLEEIREAQRNVMLGFPGLIGLRGIGGGIADPNTFGGSVSIIANTIGDNSQTVSSHGTRVQLIATSTPCRWVTIVANSTNTLNIYCGGPTIASGRGRSLVPLQAETFYISDVSKVWIDSDVNGEGVSFVYGV